MHTERNERRPQAPRQMKLFKDGPTRGTAPMHFDSKRSARIKHARFTRMEDGEHATQRADGPQGGRDSEYGNTPMPERGASKEGIKRIKMEESEEE